MIIIKMITKVTNALRLEYFSPISYIYLYGFTLTRAKYLSRLRLANLAFKAEVTSDFTNNPTNCGLEETRQVRKCCVVRFRSNELYRACVDYSSLPTDLSTRGIFAT